MKKQHQNQRPKGGPAPQKSPSQPAQRARGGPPLQAQKTKPPPQPVQEPREPKETNLAKLLVECAEEEDLGLFELSHVCRFDFIYCNGLCQDPNYNIKIDIMKDLTADDTQFSNDRFRPLPTYDEVWMVGLIEGLRLMGMLSEPLFNESQRLQIRNNKPNSKKAVKNQRTQQLLQKKNAQQNGAANNPTAPRGPQPKPKAHPQKKTKPSCQTIQQWSSILSTIWRWL